MTLRCTKICVKPVSHTIDAGINAHQLHHTQSCLLTTNLPLIIQVSDHHKSRTLMLIYKTAHSIGEHGSQLPIDLGLCHLVARCQLPQWITLTLLWSSPNKLKSNLLHFTTLFRQAFRQTKHDQLDSKWAYMLPVVSQLSQKTAGWAGLALTSNYCSISLFSVVVSNVLWSQVVRRVVSILSTTKHQLVCNLFYCVCRWLDARIIKLLIIFGMRDSTTAIRQTWR